MADSKLLDRRFAGWSDQLGFSSGSKGNQRESASGSGQSASGKMADKEEMLASCSDHQLCKMCGMYDDDELCTWGYPIGNFGRNVGVNCLHCVWVFESEFIACGGHPSYIACIEQLRPSTHHVTICCL